MQIDKREKGEKREIRIDKKIRKEGPINKQDSQRKI